MDRDIVLFCYYSSITPPKECWLGISDDIAHRNLFLRPCGKSIHFEFPAFEDHTYNSICYGHGVKSLIKHESENDKYIIFRTRDPETGKNNIIGYYRLGKAYYQETTLFDANGFIWGIEAEPAHLIRKSIIESRYGERNYLKSWGSNNKWKNYLHKLIDEIEKQENISDQYQTETNNLISIFKDENKIREWKDNCMSCEQQKNCKIYQSFKRYKHKNGSDMFTVINYIYNTSNIYSRNVLDDKEKYPKKYLKLTNGG